MTANLQACKTVEEVMEWMARIRDTQPNIKKFQMLAALRQVEKLTLERAAQIFNDRVKELRGKIFPDGQGQYDRENYFEIAQAEADAKAIRTLSPTNPKEA